MTVQDVIDSFREGAPEILEWTEFAKNLFQDAIRVTMELNTKYHTPKKKRKIMNSMKRKAKIAITLMIPIA